MLPHQLERSKDGSISYTVPDGVTKIADGAFDHSKLSEVILPASVTEIGTAFDKAPNIKIVHEESK